ncbi:MAG: hypothetical protein ACI87O_001341 [Planctomycetota bacterium]
MSGTEASKKAFAAKLARLRRDKAPAVETPSPPIVPGPEAGSSAPLQPSSTSSNPKIPIWVRKRLQGGASTRRAKEPASSPSAPSDVPRLMGRPDELQLSSDNSYWFRRRLYPVQYVHGDWPLQRALDVSNDNFVLLTGDVSLNGLDASKAVYLDTETTGLSGGAGVFVYMVGLASFTEDGLEVWQGFMDGPEQEASLLQEVARRIEASGGVVSFFGKSFDRHRLQDKMAVHSIASPFDALPHLDLYHPLRRLHRGVYVNSRLQTMEHALCGLVRSDDLPGALAPEAWFDYLGNRPHRLEGVFRHNCDDVLSLVTLLAWLAEVDQRAHAPNDLKAEVARELALCEALVANRRYEHALQRSQPFLQRFGLQKQDASGDDSSPVQSNTEVCALWWLQAEALRRLHRGAEAMASLQPLLDMPGEHAWGARTRILAAKILEHEQRDLSAAHSMCLAAIKMLAGLRSFQGRPALERDVQKREKRLASKQISEN